MNKDILVFDTKDDLLFDGVSLYGTCSRCMRRVDNYDPNHRVTSIVRGGRGVECVLRGDITAEEAWPLRTVEED